MATTTESSFTFPREYHFPAFFTRQTNLTTLHAQRNKWSDLILAYARHNRIFRLSLSEAADSDLFVNRKLDRRLQFDDIRDVISYMHTDGRVEYVGGKTTGDVVFLYWRKPEEWAELVENYVEETGQKGSVLTVYELVEGDGTKGNGNFSQTRQYVKDPMADPHRHSRHGHRCPSKSSEHPRQTKQSSNIRPGRLIRRQILLSTETYILIST
ncbi:hypothetical protein FOIG_02195 [Fusarium odoratissimum NRRL 54006]|uniref:Vacuolar protein-sorting-associated protein 25 n=1 Tax=Fusarium odoratissimum (strain NRRL 54006) TaxID=1089451 RepID=X0K711_FUSO5|nr:uncharacterized protein FOIG_02195 [Fusarium odoratissimum NRRL 54006]EXM09334.1 hypothetical protein FOIG_02195 [Fusarium odoratissimum NRRL 54006]